MDICKHNEYCGGCVYQGIPYEEQLNIKEKEVLELLIERNINPKEYLPIVGASEIYRYRNKMEYTFGDFVKDGEMTLGMHQKGRFMSVMTVEQCQLVHEDFNRILRATLDFCVEKGYRKYHKKTHKGLMRHLLLRRGVNTGELLITISTSGESDFDEEGYVELLSQLEGLENKIVGILHVINENIADAFKCDEMRVLQGRNYYNENIMGLNFRVGALSFFQTNIHAVERLYSDGISLIEDYKNKTVFDLFCGTGTISQAMATKAKRVVGVEINQEAVGMAKESAKLNGFNNCEFICGDVFKTLDNLEEKPEVVVVDPPRAGVQIKALDKIASYDIDEILYISCNPKTLIENLQFLEYRGYNTENFRLYDNFPFTKHVESIAKLKRRK